MRVAFVGKGGSGKTTMSSLFAQYLSQNEVVLAVDADVNIHMAEMLLGARPAQDWHISEKAASETIRRYLMGDNPRIASPAHFKKTTPPGSGSRLVDLTDKNNWILQQYAQHVHDKLMVMAVGSYSEDGIASGCYHGSLAIFESILSHTLDRGSLVADMVAGTDAFANTLFSQFDALVFVVEPTQRSRAVLEQYIRLSRSAGVADRLLVVGNKVEDADDAAFIEEAIGGEVAFGGAMSRSAHLLQVDKGRATSSFDLLDSEDQAIISTIGKYAATRKIDMQKRLVHLWDMHKEYATQDYVVHSIGDIQHQIDPEFSYATAVLYR